jgi:hypothetical protein
MISPAIRLQASEQDIFLALALPGDDLHIRAEQDWPSPRLPHRIPVNQHDLVHSPMNRSEGVRQVAGLIWPGRPPNAGIYSKNRADHAVSGGGPEAFISSATGIAVGSAMTKDSISPINGDFAQLPGPARLGRSTVAAIRKRRAVNLRHACLPQPAARFAAVASADSSLRRPTPPRLARPTAQGPLTQRPLTQRPVTVTGQGLASTRERLGCTQSRGGG